MRAPPFWWKCARLRFACKFTYFAVRCKWLSSILRVKTRTKMLTSTSKYDASVLRVYLRTLLFGVCKNTYKNAKVQIRRLRFACKFTYFLGPFWGLSGWRTTVFQHCVRALLLFVHFYLRASALCERISTVFRHCVRAFLLCSSTFCVHFYYVPALSSVRISTVFQHCRRAFLLCSST